MESLGHYLLRERIALPGVGAVEAFEGQDARTGMDVLVFKPLLEPPPKLSIPHTLAWVDCQDNAWIAEIPVGAVQAAWLAGRIDAVRLTGWCKQLLAVLHRVQEQGLPIGYIIPELIWARGSRVWLAGVGVPSPGHTWDFAGLLNTIKVLAGEAYPALPWRKALENYVVGQLEYTALIEELEAFVLGSSGLDAYPSEQDPELEARRARASDESKVGSSFDEMASSSLEARRARASEELPSDIPHDETASSSLEAPSNADQGELEADTPRPAPSKSLKVQVSEPAVPTPTPTPPRRIRIEERLEPPFEVVEPPLPKRRMAVLWLILLLLLAGGMGLWLRSRVPPSVQARVYPVEFRLQPPGPSASLVILETPEGSKMPLNVEVAQIPGQLAFDQPGIYRIRVRVQGRVPVESLIEVPNPGGVTITLK